jgi:hypothetical protein
MNTLALSLAAARAMLQMNVKSVAAAIRISDRTISKLENDADIEDNNAQGLIEFYEDCGLSFQRDQNNEIIGVVASPDLRRITLIFPDQTNPSDRIKEIRHALRQIRGVVSKTYSTDKSTASLDNAIELHIPVAARPLAVKSISDLLLQSTSMQFIDKDGTTKALTPNLLTAFFD